jgi:hypothetical protein
VADTTPAGLRSQAGPSTIRYRPPAYLPGDDLPPSLAPFLDLDTHTLIVPAENPTGPLRDLLHWADCYHLDLSGVRVEPPSLEDAYLTAIGEPAVPKANAS